MTPLGPSGAPGSRRAKTHHVIFDSSGGWSLVFDVALIFAILASVAIVMFDSVAGVRARFGPQLYALEWFFTIGFTIEYALRLWSVREPAAYARSFYGIIDLLAVVPTYLSVLVPGGQFLAVIRVLRVLRVFRVLKLARYVGEARVLSTALRAARFKISVFLVSVVTIVIVVGSVMFLVEGPEAGFTSIPRGVYWAIVTLTTVGYGDIAPQTPFGQALASVVMIMGYGIIAVPTGIVTAELAAQPRTDPTAWSRNCPNCSFAETDELAKFCRHCGESLK